MAQVLREKCFKNVSAQSQPTKQTSECSFLVADNWHSSKRHNIC